MTFLQLGKKESMMLSIHFVLFFLIPYLPRGLLLLVDTIIVRILLLAILISSAYVSPLNAIATFIVIALLFIERNKVKMQQLQEIMSQSTPDSPAIQEIQTPETAPEQPEFQSASIESHPFMPQDDSGDNSFYPVAETLNQKQPLPTEASNDGSQKAIEQLFEWVNPNPVQAPP
jgi:hypothetical protein